MPTPEPRHDRSHPPRDHPRWRESYYFSFFDERHGIGGFSSIGKRPGRGHSGSINVIWGPERPTLVASELDRFDVHDDTVRVQSLEYAAAEPYGPWRLAFDGALNDGGAAVECDHAALGTARDGGVPVTFDLEFRPDAPAYLYEERAEWDGLFDGHVDEVGRVTGELTVGGQRYAIDGRGAKDHSWGVRDWFRVQGWRWLDVVGTGVPEAALWRATFDGERWIEDGAVYAGGATVPLRGYEERIREAPRERKPLPAAVDITLRTDERDVRVEGEIVRVVPIFFTREGETAWVDRTLARCAVDGRPAWANVEFEALT